MTPSEVMSVQARTTLNRVRRAPSLLSWSYLSLVIVAGGFAVVEHIGLLTPSDAFWIAKISAEVLAVLVCLAMAWNAYVRCRPVSEFGSAWQESVGACCACCGYPLSPDAAHCVECGGEATETIDHDLWQELRAIRRRSLLAVITLATVLVAFLVYMGTPGLAPGKSVEDVLDKWGVLTLVVLVSYFVGWVVFPPKR